MLVLVKGFCVFLNSPFFLKALSFSSTRTETHWLVVYIDEISDMSGL